MHQHMWRVCRASWRPPGCWMCKMLCNRQDKEIQLTKEWLFYSTDSCNLHEDLNCRRSIEEISNPRKESFCRRSEIVSLLSIVLFCPEYLNFFFFRDFKWFNSSSAQSWHLPIETFRRRASRMLATRRENKNTCPVASIPQGENCTA